MGDGAAANQAKHEFDPAAMKSSGLKAWITKKIIRRPYWLMAFLRRYFPILKLGSFAIITRYDDVAEALQNDKAIAVPFGPRMKEMSGGPNFVLGMPDGPAYQGLHSEITRVFPYEDNENIIAPFAYKEAKRLVTEGGGTIDGVGGLLAQTPASICEEYYGLKIPDRFGFTRWTITMSSYMFGNPGDDPALKEAAFEAAALVRPLIDEAIDRAQAAPTDKTVIGRLVLRQKDEPEAMPDNIIRAIMVGMITGFAPTNIMASGHVLEVLLSEPSWLRQAEKAAKDGDDDLLKSCLFEAMRFWPINPGPFRVAAEDVVIAGGTSHAKTIKKGTTLIVSTQSAMFDPRRVDKPNVFKPNRKQTDYMLMGFGLHWCIGAPLAYAQITQTFKALLEHGNLRRAPGKEGQLAAFGPFPEHLWVKYG